MARTITLTARVRDASGHETTRTATVAVTGTPPTDRLQARPNDGSGLWPDFSNTGHLHAPGLGSTAPVNWTTGMTAGGWLPVDIPTGTDVVGRRFLGKTGINYNTRSNSDVTFYGCLFEGVQPNDNLMQIYTGGRVTFRYCTFKPSGLSMPPGNDGTRTSARTAPGTPYAKSWQYIANMVPGTVVTFDHCDIWGNAGIEATGGRDTTNPARFVGCYIHDQADTDNSGGGNYHHDGIGPDSEGGGHDTIIDGCTIASRGNTNGIALQGSSTYKRITVTGNYISGWGYAVAIGATAPWLGSNIIVADNVFSAELPCLFGPFYANRWNNGGLTNVWRGNRYQVRAGDANTLLPVTAQGQYWWPVDNAGHPADYGG